MNQEQIDKFYEEDLKRQLREKKKIKPKKAKKKYYTNFNYKEGK